MLSFVDLPQDLIFSICTLFSPQDLIALKQTCRVLHVFLSTDYIWHHINIELPLDIMQGPDPLNTISEDRIQHSVIRALRLDHNWRKKVSNIKRLTRIPHGNIVSQTQLLGSKWLVTLSRLPSQETYLSVWRLPFGPSRVASRIASLEILSSTTKFAAGIQSGGESAIIVTHGNGGERKGDLYIYTLSLKEDESGNMSGPVLELYRSVPKPEERGAFSDVHISGPVVVANFVHFPDLISDPDGVPSYKILFINTKTHIKAVMDPELPLEFHQLRTMTLSPGYLLLMAWAPKTSGNRQLYACVRALPEGILLPTSSRFISSSTPFADTSQAWGRNIVEYNLATAMSGFDPYLTSEPSSCGMNHISAVLFRHPRCHVFRFSLDFSQQGSPLETMFPLKEFYKSPSTTECIVCVGKTGQRLVWLERRWDTDEYRLMKGSFPVDGGTTMIEPLFPGHMALPFEPHTCHSLSFEEATGRVCLGLHTGEVYITEF